MSTAEAPAERRHSAWFGLPQCLPPCSLSAACVTGCLPQGEHANVQTLTTQRCGSAPTRGQQHVTCATRGTGVRRMALTLCHMAYICHALRLQHCLRLSSHQASCSLFFYHEQHKNFICRADDGRRLLTLPMAAGDLDHGGCPLGSRVCTAAAAALRGIATRCSSTVAVLTPGAPPCAAV